MFTMKWKTCNFLFWFWFGLVWFLFYCPSTHFRSFRAQSVTLTKLLLGKPPRQYLVHILLPVTDNCSSWISGRGRMSTEILSWPSLHDRKGQTFYFGFIQENIWANQTKKNKKKNVELKEHWPDVLLAIVPSARGTPCRTLRTVSPGLPHLGRAESGFRITLSLALVTVIYGPCHNKTCLCYMWTTKTQISLQIHAGWSASLLFTP